MFQKDFQKWTSRFCVIRSYSEPRNSGSMAYFPEVKKELAATPARERENERRGMGGGVYRVIGCGNLVLQKDHQHTSDTDPVGGWDWTLQKTL